MSRGSGKSEPEDLDYEVPLGSLPRDLLISRALGVWHLAAILLDTNLEDILYELLVDMPATEIYVYRALARASTAPRRRVLSVGDNVLRELNKLRGR